MTTLEPASIQLAESLPVDAVPAKLRCGSCNKLAINAVKLPCCDQSICEPCSQDLPDTCPICGHSPLSAEDCKANRSLRMTVKAFIKNEERKRSKDAPAPAPAPTAEEAAVLVPAASSPVPGAGVASEVEAASEISAAPNAFVRPRTTSIRDDTEEIVGESSNAADDSRDVQNTTEGAMAELEQEEEEEDDEDDVIITTERPEHEIAQQSHNVEDVEREQKQNGQYQQQQEQANGQQGFGFDQNQSFPNMDFANMNNFNPMMAMQGGMGMPNFGMGMPNLMGMPGMNMDPSMMFGGGFGGMGGMNDMSMSMMNMGMGMNGMGNFGGMPGMGMGGGPGFFPPNGGGGYNQQNYGSHMNQNFHHNRGFGGRPYNRGFGNRGRGYYGRGRGGWQNYGQQHHHAQNQNHNSSSFMNQQYQQQNNFRGSDETFDASAQQGATRGSPSYEPMNAPDDTIGETGQQKALTDAVHAGDTNNTDLDATNETGNTTVDSHDIAKAESVPRGNGEVSEYATNDPADVQLSIESTGVPSAADQVTKDDSYDHSANFDHATSHEQSTLNQQDQQDYGFGVRGRGGFRGGRGSFGGRSSAYGYVSTPAEQEPIAPVAPPINAPTGPKAMRAGLPNSGWYSRPQQPASSTAEPKSEIAKQPESELVVRTRSRSRSPSHTRDRHDRQQSQGAHEDSEESYERRKERDRRKRKERETRYDEDANGDVSSGKNRSRSESRDDDRSKRRHRDKDDERRSSRSHRDKSRDRRKHRHRSRSPERDSSVHGDGYESSRRKHKSDRRREDDYDDSDRVKGRSRRHSRRDDDYEQDVKERANGSSRHSKSSRDVHDRGREPKEPQSVVEPPEEEFEFKIKGKSASMKQGLDTSMAPPTTFRRERSERRSSMQTSTPVTPSTPAVDPYAAERENHRKQREAEQQKRMEGRRQSNQGLGKHSRDDEELEAPTGPRGDSGRNGKRVRKDLRRHSLKYEGEVDGYDDRDAKRWR